MIKGYIFDIIYSNNNKFLYRNQIFTFVHIDHLSYLVYLLLKMIQRELKFKPKKKILS